MATLTLDIAQGSLLDEVADAAAEREAVAVPAAGRRDGDAVPAAPALRDREAGTPAGPTLDEVVARSWSALRAARAAACLLCGGEVAPRYGSGPHPVGGACRSCGTELV